MFTFCFHVDLWHPTTSPISARHHELRRHSKMPWRSTALCSLWSVSACDSQWVCCYLFINTALTRFPAALSQPQTPNLEDDINEVILRDAGIDLGAVRFSPPEQRRKTMVAISQLLLCFYFLNYSIHLPKRNTPFALLFNLWTISPRSTPPTSVCSAVARTACWHTDKFTPWSSASQGQSSIVCRQAAAQEQVNVKTLVHSVPPTRNTFAATMQECFKLTTPTVQASN